MDLFTLAAKLKLDSSGFESQMRKAANTGKTFGDKMEKTFGKVAKAAKAVFSVVAIKKATNAVLNFAGAVASAGDAVDKQSQALGLSRKAYQEWDYILSQTGGSIDSLGVSMKTLNQAILSGGKDTEEALKEIGLSSKELQGLSQEDAFERVVRAFQKMPAGAQKSAAAVKLFGRNGMELLPLLNSDIYTIDVLREKAQELGIVMSDDAVNASVAYTDALDTLGRTFNALKYSIGAKILPALTRGMEKLTLWINKLRKAYERGGFTEMVKTLWEDVRSAVKTEVDKIKIKAADLLDLGDDASWFEIASKIPSKIYEGIKQWVSDNRLTIAKALGFVNNDGTVKEDTTWLEIGGKLIEKVKEGVTRKVNDLRITLAGLLGFTDATGKVLEDTTWGEIGKKMVEGITSAFHKGGTFLQKLILGEEYVEGESSWKQVGEKLAGWISDAFKEGGVLNTFIKNFADKVEGIATFIGTTITYFAEFIKRPENIQTIVSIITSIANAIKSAAGPITSAFAAILSDPNIWKGLGQVIESIFYSIGTFFAELLFTDKFAELERLRQEYQTLSAEREQRQEYSNAGTTAFRDFQNAENAWWDDFMKRNPPKVEEVSPGVFQSAYTQEEYASVMAQMEKEYDDLLKKYLENNYGITDENLINAFKKTYESGAGINEDDLSKWAALYTTLGQILSGVDVYSDENLEETKKNAEEGEKALELEFGEGFDTTVRVHYAEDENGFITPFVTRERENQGSGGSFAKGAWDIPYDNYPALLHRGERVLTASQARHQESGYGTAEIVSAIQSLRNDMQNLKLVVGRKTFGRAVVDYGGSGMDGYIGRSENKLAAGYGS